jgi:hypothetical protein
VQPFFVHRRTAADSRRSSLNALLVDMLFSRVAAKHQVFFPPVTFAMAPEPFR